MNGSFHIVVMADSFGNKNATAFYRLAEKFKTYLLALEPFHTRSAEIVFHNLLCKQNLGCSGSDGVSPAISCNFDKIRQELRRAQLDRVMDMVHIFSWRNGYGGGTSGISACGVNQLIDPYAGNNSYCSQDIEARAAGGISIHEFGHSIGAPVDNNVANVMNETLTGNGGCNLIGATFTAAAQQIIDDFITYRESLTI